jgi:hypothetical protein
MTGAELPLLGAELPLAGAELPLLGAELPLAGAELLQEVQTGNTGLKIGRIGIEKKAFTIAGGDDLPVVASDPAALPAPMQVKTGRAARKEVAREAPDVIVAMQEPPRVGTLSSFPPPAGGAAFGELDLSAGAFQVNTGVSTMGVPDAGGAGGLMNNHAFSLPPAAGAVGALPSDPPPARPIADASFDRSNPPLPAATPASRGFGKPIARAEATPGVSLKSLPRKAIMLYGGLGLAAALVLGGAAL